MMEEIDSMGAERASAADRLDQMEVLRGDDHQMTAKSKRKRRHRVRCWRQGHAVMPERRGRHGRASSLYGLSSTATAAGLAVPMGIAQQGCRRAPKALAHPVQSADPRQVPRMGTAIHGTTPAGGGVV
jgi:hypothetical protein